ncbi:poly-beta-1,6-N-acetyl-D-glucosamine biosynthesis protein PgaD [Acinetobacter sp. WZC-1]|uniref:poly-beta-1,6-N-acetyl-D-glucosamine biosynthesis protein PgaD n=1 Tax=Acinetobacter sp. WZC-1 TaxID=3459034 RepID=UPI00403D95CE
MKTSSLIIDLRNQLPWHRRYVSNTSTAMLWAGWLLLWRPIVLVISYISLQKPHLINHFLGTFTEVLESGFTALLACAISLWLWSNFVPSKTKRQAQPKSMQEYSDHFGLNAGQLTLSRQQKIVTVHHNADGQITQIS